MKIKILDCTLRDGGYLNNWAFKTEEVKKIITALIDAGIDLIELGFIKKEKDEESKTVFSSFDEIKNVICDFSKDREKFTGMITAGQFPKDEIPLAKNSPIKNLRLIFKKHQIEEAFEYCKNIKQKGYKLFVNPTYVNRYEKKEFVEIIKKTNKIEPYAFSIVDSIGALTQEKLAALYDLVDGELSENINLCFHSHNNLNLSFLNAKKLIEICKTRNLIIDSTIFGLGKGAGNLRTEEILQFLNKSYDILPILNLKHPFSRKENSCQNCCN